MLSPASQPVGQPGCDSVWLWRANSSASWVKPSLEMNQSFADKLRHRLAFPARNNTSQMTYCTWLVCRKRRDGCSCSAWFGSRQARVQWSAFAFLKLAGVVRQCMTLLAPPFSTLKMGEGFRARWMACTYPRQAFLLPHPCFSDGGGQGGGHNYQPDLCQRLGGVAFQVFDHQAHDIFPGSRVALFPGEHVIAKGQGAAFQRDGRTDLPTGVNIQPAVKHCERIARLGDDLAGAPVPLLP